MNEQVNPLSRPTNTEKMLADRAMLKVAEVEQLSCPYDNMYQGPRKRMLFVCSAGMLRSPTAAAVANSLGHNARSCGSATHYALIPISVNLLHWASNVYYLNEENYYETLDVFASDRETLELVKSKQVIWSIPDNYDYMDPDLVKMLTTLLYI